MQAGDRYFDPGLGLSGNVVSIFLRGDESALTEVAEKDHDLIGALVVALDNEGGYIAVDMTGSEVVPLGSVVN